MGLKIFETKLDLQGVLSGSKTVTEIQYEDSPTIPQVYVPGNKSSTTFAHNDALFSEKVKAVISNANSSADSDKFGMTKDKPEVLAVYAVDNQELAESFSDLAFQNYFEDSCSLEFSRQLIKKVKKSDEKFLKSLVDAASKEVSDAENVISVADQYFNSKFSLNKNFNSVPKDILTLKTNAHYESLKPEKVQLPRLVEIDAFSFLQSAGAKTKETSDFISANGNTAIIEQLLNLAGSQMKIGCTSQMFSYPAFKPNSKNDPNPLNTNINQKTAGFDLPSFSKPLAAHSVAGEIENYVPYSYGVNFLTDEVLSIENVAGLMTLLANEMAISVGIGRLDAGGNGLASGNKTNQYQKYFWGVTPTVIPDGSLNSSLTDSLIGVNSKNQKEFLIFDGSKSKQLGTGNGKPAINAFISDLNLNELGTISNFDNFLENAAQTFENGKSFYNTLHCRDRDLKLLTPRGLFARLIGDFSKILGDFYSTSSKFNSSEKVKDALIFSILGRNKSIKQLDRAKEYLLSFLVRKVIHLTVDDKKYPRFMPDETHLRQNLDPATNEITMNLMSDLYNGASASNSGLAKGEIIDVKVGDYVFGLFSKQDGLLDVLAKIYMDLMNECLKLSTGVASPIDENKLTKNSHLDGTALLSMLFEGMIRLCADFVPYENVFVPENEQKLTIYTNRTTPSPPFVAYICMDAIAKKSDSNDLKEIIDSGIIKNEAFKGGFSFWTAGTPINKSEVLTVKSLILTFQWLAYERDFPAICFSAAYGVVDSLRALSKSHINLAYQILGSGPQSNEIKSFVNFLGTPTGKKFGNGTITPFSLENARSKVEIVKKSLTSDAGRAEKLTRGELHAIQSLLTKTAPYRLVVVALPAGFINTSLKESFVAANDKKDPLQNASMKSTVIKRVFFSSENVVKKETAKFLLRNVYDSDSFKPFEQEVPSIAEVQTRSLVNENTTTEDFIKKFDLGNFKETQAIMNNELNSYLFRKFFSLSSSADLFAENISAVSNLPIGKQSAGLAQTFAKIYGLPPSTFDGVFETASDGNTYINKENLLSLAKLDYDIDNVSVKVIYPSLTFGEAEMFFDLFNTVFFQSGVITNRIFAPSPIEKTFGMIFEDNPQLEIVYHTYAVSVEST